MENLFNNRMVLICISSALDNFLWLDGGALIHWHRFSKHKTESNLSVHVIIKLASQWPVNYVSRDLPCDNDSECPQSNLRKVILLKFSNNIMCYYYYFHWQQPQQRSSEAEQTAVLHLYSFTRVRFLLCTVLSTLLFSLAILYYYIMSWVL